MYVRIAIEVVVALFAVFGFYSAVRLLAQRIFSSESIILAVEIQTEDDVLNAEMLIREALGSFLLASSSHIAVLVPAALCSNELMNVAHKYGVQCYIIDGEQTAERK